MRIVRTTLALALTLVVVGRASAATVSAKAISVSPSSVQGGALATGTVTLTAAAPSGGASVSGYCVPQVMQMNSDMGWVMAPGLGMPSSAHSPSSPISARC